MNRLKLLIASLFLIALGTGIVVGMGVSRTPKSHERGSWLSEELNLTPDQSEKIKAIWSDISRPGQSGFERRRQFQRERDEAVQALLTDKQKADYAAIVDKYNLQLAELNHEREQAFQAAVESTKDILTDAQRTKYDEILRRGFRGSRGDGSGGQGREGFGRGDGWRGSSTRRGGGGGGGDSIYVPPRPPRTTTAPAPATAPASL
jgi:Spy/CpxP family protein refolding chaperone